MLFGLDPPAMSSLSCLILFREVSTATLALIHSVLGGAWGSSACLFSHCFRPTFIKECEQRRLISWKCWTELGRKWKTKRRRPSRKSSGCSACEPISGVLVRSRVMSVCVTVCLPASCVPVVIPWRGGVWCLSPGWNLRTVSWFNFSVASLVRLLGLVVLSVTVLSFLCWWPIACFFLTNSAVLFVESYIRYIYFIALVKKLGNDNWLMVCVACCDTAQGYAIMHKWFDNILRVFKVLCVQLLLIKIKNKSGTDNVDES